MVKDDRHRTRGLLYNDNEVELVGTIKFYNDTVVDYNHLIVIFPSNIIRLLFGYKMRDLFEIDKFNIIFNNIILN